VAAGKDGSGMKKPSSMTKRLARETEKDLKRLSDDVDKRVYAIGGRFGDVDQMMVNAADDLKRTVDRWIEEIREIMAEQVAEDNWNL
jgi:hypothetical protein